MSYAELEKAYHAERQRNQRLDKANEILKTASGFFAQVKALPHTPVVVDVICTYRHRFGVEPICAVLTEHGIAIVPSTFYARQARGSGPGRRRVGKCWHSHIVSTVAGREIGRDQVQRLMKVIGIRGVAPRQV